MFVISGDNMDGQVGMPVIKVPENLGSNANTSTSIRSEKFLRSKGGIRINILMKTCKFVSYY